MRKNYYMGIIENENGKKHAFVFGCNDGSCILGAYEFSYKIGSAKLTHVYPYPTKKQADAVAHKTNMALMERFEHLQQDEVVKIFTNGKPQTLYSFTPYQLGNLLADSLEYYETDAKAYEDARDSGCIWVRVYDEETGATEWDSVHIRKADACEEWTADTLVEVF